jgi:hypothetical protein
LRIPQIGFEAIDTLQNGQQLSRLNAIAFPNQDLVDAAILSVGRREANHFSFWH